MSVIAKMTATDSVKYGQGHQVSFSCVCENELMAMYSPDNEDVLFTKASPSGSARIVFQNDPGSEYGDAYYFIFQHGEKPNLDGAVAWAKLKCYGITDYGGTSRQVELINHYNYQKKFTDSIEVFSANYKIMIDNPGAYQQFTAGEEDWYLTIYSAGKLTMREALALAHAANKEAV